MFENSVFPQLADMQPEEGAPPPWNVRVHDFLNEHFSDRWNGSDGPILWPPRSLDITPWDFSLWVYVKHMVYQMRVTDIEDLRKNMRTTIKAVNAGLLSQTWKEIESCLNVFGVTRGARVEEF